MSFNILMILKLREILNCITVVCIDMFM